MLLFFPFQGLVDDINAKKERAFDKIIERHVQQARLDGYFTDTNISSMKNEIATIFYINSSEINVICTTTPKYRTKNFDPNELIHYEVYAPLKKIFVMQSYWGLSDDENTRHKQFKGDVGSERLP